MPYIKVLADGTVLLAGTVATDEMLQEGFFEYRGEVPRADAYRWDPAGNRLVPDIEASRAAKLREIAEARWKEETSGVVLKDGTIIRTDREAQALITGAALAALNDPTTPIEWKGANGWVVLTPQQVIQVASLVRRHVQRCFSKEKALVDRIMAAGTLEELEAIHWEGVDDEQV